MARSEPDDLAESLAELHAGDSFRRGELERCVVRERCVSCSRSSSSLANAAASSASTSAMVGCRGGEGEPSPHPNHEPFRSRAGEGAPAEAGGFASASETDEARTGLAALRAGLPHEAADTARRRI